VIVIAFAILGGVLGFLRFNSYPAHVFMGDAGSQFLGFTAAVGTILLTDGTRAPFSPVLGLFIIGLPVLDTLCVMTERLWTGRSPFRPDRSHIHHKLMAAGLHHHETVVVIYLLQAALAGAAVALRWQSDAWLLVLYGLFAAGVMTLYRAGGVVPWRRAAAGPSAPALWRRLQASVALRATPRLIGWGVAAFLALSAFLPRQVPADVGLVAAALAGGLVAGLALLRRARPLVVRLGLYVAGVFVVYLAEAAPAAWALNLFFVALAALVALGIALPRERGFALSPMDALVALIALTMLQLPELRLGEVALGPVAAKLVVLFFAYELTLSVLDAPLTRVGLMALWTLAVLGVRAWIA
jgi:UDP-GlcNAc:undecaprenyl-phosphate GlcNAc-1-phosphate transferase